MSNTRLASEGSHRPVRAGYGCLPAGSRVRFVGWADTFARRLLAGDEVFTVQWCGLVRNELNIRIAEHPGFTFRRYLFGEIA